MAKTIAKKTDVKIENLTSYQAKNLLEKLEKKQKKLPQINLEFLSKVKMDFRYLNENIHFVGVVMFPQKTPKVFYDIKKNILVKQLMRNIYTIPFLNKQEYLDFIAVLGEKTTEKYFALLVELETFNQNYFHNL